MAREVTWIDDAAGLAEIAPQWDALAALDSTPFSLSAWYRAWWDGFGNGRRPRVCTVWDGGELAGLLPLCAANGRLESMANIESCVVRPLARDTDALDRLAAAAVTERYDLLEVRRLPEGDTGIEALRRAAGAHGRFSLVEPDVTSPIVDTAGSADDYREATKSKWHRNLRRLSRKLLREHDADFHLIEPPADLKAELAAGFAVESSGWKMEQGTAILARPEAQTFYRALAQSFHERGELRVSWIAVDGRMIAWDLAILHGNRLYSPKSGYLEEYKALAPGLVLELATIERCFEQGIEAHELLGADEPYKLRFSTSKRYHRVFRAFPRRPMPAMRYAWRRYAPRSIRERRYMDDQSGSAKSP